MFKGLKRPSPASDEYSLDSRAATLCHRYWACLLLILAMLLVFWDVLVHPAERLLSLKGTDLFSQFIPWRDFAAREMRSGNLPLWNPHTFAGTPFFANFQSAMLYPPNWVFLILPLPLAINLSIALHVLLAGLFTFAWMRRRGLSPLTAFLGGMGFMFCGQHFLHISAGHLPNLCAIAWIPLLFLCVDAAAAALLNSRLKAAGRWTLAGAAVVALQILAGHPQYVFYTAVTVGGYTILQSVRHRLVRLPIALSLMYSLGILLAAVQLLPGMAAAKESVRSGGVPYAFASMFSLPPENLLTLVVPGLFGDVQRVAYWGRCYLWEMSLFIGLVPALLALSAIFGRHRPTRIIPLIVVGATLLLALGSRTPLFQFLYDWVPGFNLFRGNSKFAVFTNLFLLLLACGELDRIRHVNRRPRAAVILSFLLASVIGLFAVILMLRDPASTTDAWASFMRMALPQQETYLPPGAYQNPAFVDAAAYHATGGLLWAFLVLMATGMIFSIMPRLRWTPLLLVALASVELLFFARRNRPTFPIAEAMPAAVRQRVLADPGEYRVLCPDNPNSAMYAGANDVWGIDPGVSKRYAEFIAWSQGHPPDKASQNMVFRQAHPALTMLRCRYIFETPLPGRPETGVTRLNGELPQVFLAGSYRLAAGRDDAFRMMDSDGFNPRQEVILETTPNPEPQGSADPGTARIIEQSPDRLLIEARVTSPALLVVTDGYASGWIARPESPRMGQSPYRILPANYALRAVPLGTGAHRIVMEYHPPGFRAGIWISLGTAAVALLTFVALGRPRRRNKPATQSGE